MEAVIIHESLTGNTARAAGELAAAFGERGVETTVCSRARVDLAALARADLVVVGTWVDGLILFGHRPGGAAKLRQLPVIDHKKAAVFMTHAVNPGKAAEKLAALVGGLGGDVVAARSFKKSRTSEEVGPFADEILAALGATASASTG